MPALQMNIQIERGTTFDLDSGYEAGGVGVDLSGYIGAFNVRANAAAPLDPHLSCTSAGSRVILGTDGSIRVRVPPSATRDTVITSGMWSFTLSSPPDTENPEGVVIATLYGIVTVFPIA